MIRKETREKIFPLDVIPVFKIFIIILLVFFLAAQLVETPNKENKEVVLIAVGDTGTGEEMQYRVADAMEKVCRESFCSGVLILGDIIQDEDGVSSVYDPDFQMKFEKPYQGIDVPFYMALGNHDYYGCVECEIAYSTMSAKWKLPSRYYKESFGALIDLVILDTENLDRKQIDWAVNELKNSKSKWKIVAGHRPLVSYDERHGSSEEERKPLLEEIICQKADFYLTGHDHNLRDDGDHCGVRLFTIGGGGAPLGKITKSDLPFALSDYGFARIEANNKKISVEFINIEGEIIYSWFKERKD